MTLECVFADWYGVGMVRVVGTVVLLVVCCGGSERLAGLPSEVGRNPDTDPGNCDAFRMCLVLFTDPADKLLAAACRSMG